MINKDLIQRKDEILKICDRIKEQGRVGKRNLEPKWYRNILFLVGRQWIIYDDLKRIWEDWKSPSWYEKPIKNVFAITHNTLKTILTQEDPRLIIRPQTDSDDAKATAEIADIVVDVIEAEADMKKVKEIAASWNIETGNCFFHNYYDVGPQHGQQFMQHEQCADEKCGIIMRPSDLNQNGNECLECGGTSFKPALTGMQPYGEMADKGKLGCDAVPPFEMFFNAEVQDFKELTEVVRSKVMPVSTLKEMYPDCKEKIEGSSTGDKASEMYMKALAYVTGIDAKTGGAAGGEGKSPSQALDYMYCLPTNEFPEGLQVVFINDEIVELDVLMYKKRVDDREVPYIPIIHIGNERVPGSIWHRTKQDDVAPKQAERNKLQSFILLWIYSMSGGKWLEPDGVDMDTPTGQPNQVMKYTPGLGGAKPELVNGIPVHIVLLRLLEMADKEIEDLAGSYDVLKGQLPKGLNTAAGLRMLTERAFSRHNEMIRNWERGLEDVTMQQIEILRQFGIEERKKTFENDMGNWETKTFTNADLQGGIEIKVEPGSTIPRSKAAEDAAIFESITAGLINPNDPKVNYKILEKLGQTDLASGVGEDIKDAVKEWKDFLKTGQTRARAGIDNDMIHWLDAVSRAKSDEFYALPPKFQQTWLDHVFYHKARLDAQMAEQQAAQMGPEPAPKAKVAA